METEVCFRPATERDVPTLLWLIQLFDEHHKIEIGQKDLISDGFGEKHFKALLAELTSPVHDEPPPAPSPADLPPAETDRNERIIGYALYYNAYSTWEGRVMFLEDLFVRKEYRNKGYGTALFKHIAKLAVDMDCCRMTLHVLEGNTKARKLFDRLGGQTHPTWLTVRLYQPELQAFATQEQAVNGNNVTYRPATADEIPQLLSLIQLMAADLNEPEGVKITTKELLRDGFGEDCYFKVLLAELAPPPNGPPSASSPPAEKNGRVVGYAVYYFTYNSQQGKTVYLEDVFVKPGYRDKGYGTSLMRQVAKIGSSKGCHRMMWQVCDWNSKAIRLYKRVGGTFVPGLLTVKLLKPSFHKLVNSESS